MMIPSARMITPDPWPTPGSVTLTTAGVACFATRMIVASSVCCACIVVASRMLQMPAAQRGAGASNFVDRAHVVVPGLRATQLRPARSRARDAAARSALSHARCRTGRGAAGTQFAISESVLPPSGTTRCAVSATCVVLNPQMCTSCTSVTPGSDPRNAVTTSVSIPCGTASSARLSESRSNPQLPAVISATRSRLTTGSIHVHPVRHDRQRGDDHPGRRRRIAEHVEERAANVQVVVRPRRNPSAVPTLMRCRSAPRRSPSSSRPGPGC